eukprot:s3023_g12.t1
MLTVLPCATVRLLDHSATTRHGFCNRFSVVGFRLYKHLVTWAPRGIGMEAVEHWNAGGQLCCHSQRAAKSMSRCRGHRRRLAKDSFQHSWHGRPVQATRLGSRWAAE